MSKFAALAAFASIFAMNSTRSQHLELNSAAPSPELIGMYVSMADLNDKLKESVCGAWIKRPEKMITRQSAIAEVSQRVSRNDWVDISQYFQSESFSQKMLRNTEYVAKFISLGVADGAEVPFLCGTLFGVHMANSQPILTRWKALPNAR